MVTFCTSVKSLFAVNGTNGEGMTMSVTERKLVAEAWIKAVEETKQHLMVQVGGAPLPDVIELVGLLIFAENNIQLILRLINEMEKIHRRITQVVCASILYSAYQNCTSNLLLPNN